MPTPSTGSSPSPAATRLNTLLADLFGDVTATAGCLPAAPSPEWAAESFIGATLLALAPSGAVMLAGSNAADLVAIDEAIGNLIGAAIGFSISNGDEPRPNED